MNNDLDMGGRQRRRFPRSILPFLVFFTAGVAIKAQWLTQHVDLQPGWNAVYLEVHPEPAFCDEIFASTPVESVWKWDRRFTTVQFADDPTELIPEDPHWMVWLPPANPDAFLGHLYALQGGQSYLIKVASNAAPFTLTLPGKVILPDPEWYPQSLNLMGFAVHSNNPPYFSEFFAFTPDVDVLRGHLNELYAIDRSNRAVRIVQPARERVQPGRAYWVWCEGKPDYLSALHVTPSGAGELDFAVTESRQDLAIFNAHPSNSLSVVVRQSASEAAPEGQPELAGPVALSYLTRNASNDAVWLPFPAGGVTQTLAVGETWNLQLGIRRGDMPFFTPSGTNGAEYQSILNVSDAERSLLIRVPVTAKRYMTGPLEQVDHAGLWVGVAVFNKVNAPAYTNGLLPTFSPLDIRLIVHVDAQGQSRLLQQAILVWEEAGAHYVIYGSDTNLPAGADPVYRVSSAAFPLMTPVALTGNLTNTLSGTVTVAFDDPVNPFLHRYHPMHDNKDWNFAPSTNAVESYTISRAIELTSLSVTNSANPAADDTAAGIYRETFTGLRAQPIEAEGLYQLKRISVVNEIK